jgi:hypothetical protein
MEAWTDERIRTAFKGELDRRRNETRRSAPAAKALAQSTTEAEPALFDPKNDVSADAKYIAGRIVTHLWIISLILVLLWELLK